MARIGSSFPSTGFRIALGCDSFTLRYNDGRANILVEIPAITTDGAPGYQAILKAMGQPLRHKLTHVTITSMSYDDRNVHLWALAAISTLCPSVTTVSLQSSFPTNVACMELLSKHNMSTGWLFPLMDRIELHVQQFEREKDALCKLVRASNDEDPNGRPTRLVCARLHDGWIRTAAVQKLVNLGITVRLEKMGITDVSPVSVGTIVYRPF